MLWQNLKDLRIILASKSPRRQQLLSGLEIEFEVRTKEVDETFPEDLQEEAIPLFLSRLKAEAFRGELLPDELLLTADTIVWVNGHVLNKPDNEVEALAMLLELNGTAHSVYTGVCLTTSERQECFFDETKVSFVQLSEDELRHYVERYKPFDKAGSYGAQELIGYIAIDRIEGSYFNVMGLPLHKLYDCLRKW